jgi:hypothetical protein
MSNLVITPLATEIVGKMAQGRGFSIWWEYHGTQLTPDQLRDIVGKAGGDPSRIPDIDPTKALRQAVKDWNKQEVRTDISLGLNHTLRTKVNSRIASEEGSDIYIGILHAARKGKRETGDEQRELLQYCTGTHTWIQPGTSKFAESLRKLIHKRQHYYDGSTIVGNVVMPAIQSCKAAFHIKKGWWFLPSEHAEEIAKVQQALEKVETFEFSCGGIPAGLGFERSIQRGARANLATEIEGIEKLVDGWMDMSRVVRSDTRQSVMERFESINQRITLYTASLEVSLADMQEKAAELRERAQELIDQKDAEFGTTSTGGGGTGRVRASTRRATIAAMPEAVFKQAWNGFCRDADGNVLEVPADREEAVDMLAAALDGM